MMPRATLLSVWSDVGGWGQPMNVKAMRKAQASWALMKSGADYVYVPIDEWRGGSLKFGRMGVKEEEACCSGAGFGLGDIGYVTVDVKYHGAGSNSAEGTEHSVVDCPGRVEEGANGLANCSNSFCGEWIIR